MTIASTHHNVVRQGHRYSQHQADDPDYDDDHLGRGLADMGPQWEHDRLISGIVKCGNLEHLELGVTSDGPSVGSKL